MKVVLSRIASADLQEIGDWVAQESRRRAKRLVEDLEDACMGLARNPRRFQLVPRHEATGVRRRVRAPYLIFYRIGAGQVTVLRIVHGARDYEPLLFPDTGPS